jgi:hypothetical protein
MAKILKYDFLEYTNKKLYILKNNMLCPRHTGFSLLSQDSEEFKEALIPDLQIKN